MESGRGRHQVALGDDGGAVAQEEEPELAPPALLTLASR